MVTIAIGCANENKESVYDAGKYNTCDWTQCRWITKLARNSNSKLSPDLTNNPLMNKRDPNFNILATTIATCGLSYS